MKVVLDTNVILSSISRRSPFRLVMDKFEAGRFSLCLTTDILLEYEEKIAQNFSPTVAELVIGAMVLKNNVIRTAVFFQLRLIYPDLDDNKFVDCAFASNADYLVTNDRDFNTLKNVPFPSLRVIRLEEFVKILEKLP